MFCFSAECMWIEVGLLWGELWKDRGWVCMVFEGFVLYTDYAPTVRIDVNRIYPWG